MDSLIEFLISVFQSLPHGVQVAILVLLSGIAVCSGVASVINGWERGLRNAGMTVPRWLLIAQIVVNPLAWNPDKAGEAWKRLRAVMEAARGGGLPGGKP